MKNRALNRSMLIAAGAIVGLAAAAVGQDKGKDGVPQGPYLVNVSGATLLRALYVTPALANDFCDVDGDGLVTPTVDQLAPAGGCPAPFPSTQYFQIQGRSTGSVNGLRELRDWYGTYACVADIGAPGDPGYVGGDLPIIAASEGAWHNRIQYILTPAGLPPQLVSPPGNPLNPGGAPVRSTRDGTYRVTCDTTCDLGGIQIDIATVDVPALWGVRQETGAPFWAKNPGEPGYGDNLRTAVTITGAPTSQTNRLIALAPLNFNYDSPDANTAYDNLVVTAPVAGMVNPGVGLPEIRKSDLRHLNATGRTRGGENLMVVTRDVGSGTRNAWANGICLDPSYCIGENIGVETSSSARDLVGPNFQPSNKLSSSRVEGTVINHRLATTHSGAERGAPGSGQPAWLDLNRAEVFGVINDDLGSTVAARPSISNVLDNTIDGYNITGPASLVTVGDRNGGAEGDPNLPRCQTTAPNGNPLMRNKEAANFLNNIFGSIAAVKAEPTGDENFFSPGEFLATRFILTTATDFAKTPGDPCGLIKNPNLIQEVQDFTRTASVLGRPEFQTYDFAMTGLVPSRTVLTSGTYSDGQTGNTFRTQNDTSVNGGTVLNVRNKISGDFDNNGQRNWSDIPGMILAWRDRNDATPFVADLFDVGSEAIVEVLGDFNGDGSFTTADVRYFADGLAIDPVAGTVVANRKVNRLEGFTRVDAAFGGNFFGTSLATGASYQNGDSAGDIAGNAQTPGFAPNGANGTINAADIDYVYAQMRTVGDRDVNFDDLNDAIAADFSADINGDGSINQDDICFLVTDILGTDFSDLNLNGMPNEPGAAPAGDAPVLGGSGWAQGDVDGDGDVDAADVAIINGSANDPCTKGGQDCNENGVDDAQDISSGTSKDCFDFTAAAGTAGGANGVPDECECIADWNRDGTSNSTDVSDFINTFFADQAGGGPNGDVNCDGTSNSTDVSDFINVWFAAQAGQLPFAGCTI